MNDGGVIFVVGVEQRFRAVRFHAVNRWHITPIVEFQVGKTSVIPHGRGRKFLATLPKIQLIGRHHIMYRACIGQGFECLVLLGA